jgi:hypothetical protein
MERMMTQEDIAIILTTELFQLVEGANMARTDSVG